jgi:hypothetical protein
MSEEGAPKAKPAWLERLEQESYQAELIISGVAIVGALQLPGLIKMLAIWSMDTFSQDFMDVVYLLFVYLIMASQMLIVTFVLHFLLRTLWIGNVGLASVYPNGINTESKKFSQDFGGKLKQAFPDFGAFNKRLDDLCSVMFALSSMLAMVFLSIALFLGAMVLLSYLISMLYGGLSFRGVLYGLGGFLFFSFLLQGLLGIPQLREKEWVKRIHFPVNMFFSKLLYGPFYRPVTYITYIFMTNSRGYGSMGVTFVFIFAVGVFSFPIIQETQILFTQEGYQEKVRLKSTRMRYFFYDDQRPPDDYIPFASIPSDVVRGTVLPVFVNLRPDPEAVVDEHCDNDSYEAPQKKARAWVECLQKYYHFQFGEQSVEPTGFYTYEWEESGQYGIRAYLPTEGLPPGGHELRVTFDGEGVGSSLQHEIMIPFQYFPEESLQ